jgi:cytochrome c biogenesis protein CcdA
VDVPDAGRSSGKEYPAMTTNREELKKSRLRARMTLLVVVTLIVSVAGYVGFRVFRQFDVGGATGIGLIVVAATVGIASFFSPCSFPLLLTTLSRQAATNPDHRMRGALRFAAGASIGAVAFVTAFGLLLSIGGGVIARQFTFASTQGRVLRTIVGMFLIVMGLAQLGRVRIPFGNLAQLAQPIDRRRAEIGDETKFTSRVLYGFGYLVAGFG